MSQAGKQLPLFQGPVRIRVTMVREEGDPVPRKLRTPADVSQYANELRDLDRELRSVPCPHGGAHRTAVTGMRRTKRAW